MSGEPKKEGEEGNKPLDPMSLVLKELEEQKKVIAAMGAGLLELSDRVKAKESQGGGAPTSDFMKFLQGVFGTGESSDPFDKMAKHADAMARLADALQHYRRPTMPYSPGDRFLMRAGARSVHRMVYEGVKTKQSETGLSDKEIDKELGFAEEEEEESEHVKE